MQQYLDPKLLEQGRQIIRNEGINFSEFKKQVGKKKFTEDEWVSYYNAYAIQRTYCNISPKEFFGE